MRNILRLCLQMDNLKLSNSSINRQNYIKKCTGKDTLQRMNYLYQASNALATENVASNLASIMYSNLLVSVSRKAVQRMDVEVKRSICKGCRSLLLAGITCKVRIKKKRSVWRCLNCNSTKVFDLRNKDYQPWTQKDESIVEILNYKDDSYK